MACLALLMVATEIAKSAERSQDVECVISVTFERCIDVT